ncbi:hypothetical protein HPB51_006465 [Rhipicephalus microplus]|uniref:Tyrosine-protein kinase ephrin type A/B receptor-like domain-containing protein n=1 Tax=Rhipicephalus microplus TaxID=6941 RepID=A0A9J6E7D0_RHIMP|nr:hypothetical protein HPB51_006465 [Rhipicephalus microplus]
MPTVEVLTSIMGVTVIVMNLYRLAVSITGFDAAAVRGSERPREDHHGQPLTSGLGSQLESQPRRMELPGPASLVFIILSVSGITNTARLFAAEYGTQVRLPCDENVETTDELSGLSTFDAVWTDPRGVTLADDGDQSGAELRGEPWVDAFSGDLSLAAVDFADAVYETSVAGVCECGCELIANVCLACGPGQYGKDGACHVCSVGSFNDRHGALCCQRCPFLYVTWGRGATSRKECSGIRPTATLRALPAYYCDGGCKDCQSENSPSA